MYRFRRAGYSTDYLVDFCLSSMFYIIFWDRFRLEGDGVKVQTGGLFHRLSGGFLVVLYVLYYLLGQISTGRRRCTGLGGRDIPPIIWWIFPLSQTARTAAGGSSILIRYARTQRILYDAVGNRTGSTCSGADCLYLGPCFCLPK